MTEQDEARIFDPLIDAPAMHEVEGEEGTYAIESHSRAGLWHKTTITIDDDDGEPWAVLITCTCEATRLCEHAMYVASSHLYDLYEERAKKWRKDKERQAKKEQEKEEERQHDSHALDDVFGITSGV